MEVQSKQQVFLIRRAVHLSVKLLTQELFTSTAAADMSANAGLLKITGEDSTGATITENIDFTANHAAGAQVIGTTIFHQVTQVEISGAAGNNAMKVLMLVLLVHNC